MVAEVAGWGLKSLRLKEDKLRCSTVWQTLPGHADNWDKHAIKHFSDMIEGFEAMKLPTKKIFYILSGRLHPGKMMKETADSLEDLSQLIPILDWEADLAEDSDL